MIEVLETLQRHSVEFCSMQEQIDTTTASGRLLFLIIAAFGEFEKAVIRERTVAGLAEARRQGKTLGRPRAHQDLPDLVIEEAVGRMSLRKASAELGMPLTTLRDRLKDMKKKEVEVCL